MTQSAQPGYHRYPAGTWPSSPDANLHGKRARTSKTHLAMSCRALAIRPSLGQSKISIASPAEAVWAQLALQLPRLSLQIVLGPCGASRHENLELPSRASIPSSLQPRPWRRYNCSVSSWVEGERYATRHMRLHVQAYTAISAPKLLNHPTAKPTRLLPFGSRPLFPNKMPPRLKGAADTISRRVTAAEQNRTYLAMGSPIAKFATAASNTKKLAAAILLTCTELRVSFSHGYCRCCGEDCAR